MRLEIEQCPECGEQVASHIWFSSQFSELEKEGCRECGATGKAPSLGRLLPCRKCKGEGWIWEYGNCEMIDDIIGGGWVDEFVENKIPEGHIVAQCKNSHLWLTPKVS